MPAQGKTNASRVTAGDRILVQVTETGVSISATKTGPGVQVARVTGKGQGKNVTSYGTVSRRMTYNVETTAGTLENLAPIQTMWLAPEDAAGIKRAHAEALLEDQERAEAARHAVTREVIQEAEELLDRMEAKYPPAPAEEEPTGEEALAAIGGCWAGGALTGKALKAHAEGDYRLALSLAADQKALQEAGGPDAFHPETLADRPELTQRAETLGSVAAEVLDLAEPARDQAVAKSLAGVTLEPELGFQEELAAYSPVVAIPFTELGRTGVLVAPIGTPAPGPEDLSDLAVTLAEEMAEHLDPEEVRVPKSRDLRCQPGDVVTIHRGDRLYRVERVEEDQARDGITREVRDLTMARVSPVDPEDHRDAQWVHVDLLHVRRPVARVHTVEVTGRVRQTREVFRAQGRERLVAVRTILVDSARLPVATLVEVPSFPVGQEALLRAGEALVVDGRCFQVTETGELEPAPHRDRLFRARFQR